MNDTQITAMQRAIVLLKAAGVAYAILTPEGEKHGELEIVERRKMQRNRTGFNYKAVYLPVMEPMQPGDCKRIPVPEETTPEAMRSAVTGYASQLWGAGNYISTIHAATREVEILRVA